MPFTTRRSSLLAAAIVTLTVGLAHAQTAPLPTDKPAPSSAGATAPPGERSAQRVIQQRAEIFYQVLLSELSLTDSDDPGMAYGLMLDAAHKSKDEELYARAVEIAIAERAGEQALTAAKDWAAAFPQSRTANRAVVQVLVALNQTAASVPELRKGLDLAPAADKNELIVGIPALYARVSNRGEAADLIQKALAPELANPTEAAAAWATVGRLRLAANQNDAAFDALQQSVAVDPNNEAAMALALDLIEIKRPQAEDILKRYLAGKPTPEIRLAYTRYLIERARYVAAQQQVDALLQDQPNNRKFQLLSAQLQLQRNELDAAQVTLQRYLAQPESEPQSEQAAESRETTDNMAYVMLAQVAEKRGDWDAADTWLRHITAPAEQNSVTARRAELAAKRGDVSLAKALMQTLPANTPAQIRARTLAEVAMLRAAERYQDAYDLQAPLLRKNPDDAGLLYEQAILAEKIGRYAEMDRLLTQCIALDPNGPDAYNALGYSMADRGQDLPRAQELIAKALALAPGNPMIEDSMGWVLYRQGDLQGALKYLQDAYASFPDGEVAAHLGEVLWQLGRKDEARAIWNQAAQAQPDSEPVKETMLRLLK